MKEDDGSPCFILGMALALLATIVALAMLGVIDMDDTKQRQPINPPPCTCEVYVKGATP